MKEVISADRKEFLSKKKRRKRLILLTQIFILFAFIFLWEFLANEKILNEFITSKPSRVVNTILDFKTNHLFMHLWVTLYETLIGFLLGTLIGTVIASLLWWSPFASRVFEPYLIVLHSLPKVALGPIIIVWAGAGTNAIIVMALAISLIVTILEMLNGFLATDKNLIKLAHTFNANKWQIFTKIVFPSNVSTLINAMKVNIGLSLVGVISGEFLVSKAGLGYLIVYGGQVFKLDLVMTSVIILGIMAALMYHAVVILEKIILRWMMKAEV
ncbi:MAG: ABC transporter permease [Clostridia bacterium]|nr:ABC transporter permease [Clostridia bacterium]